MMAKKDESYRNSEYWEDRIANETWKTYNDLEEKNIDLLKMYEKSSRNIKNELLALAEKAEKHGGLGRTDQYRFNKLLGQQGEIFKECERLGEQIEKHSINGMKQGGKDVYKNIMQSLGNNDFSYPNKKTMEQMLRSPWHGSFFSERLWRDMGKLEQNLNGVINDGVATGKTITEMAVQLSNIMQKSFNAAHTLVRTETINYMNRSALRSYKDAGVTEVQWWAAEDERTCEICGTHHGDKYNIDKAPILPCHTGCRCTWIPVIGTTVKKFEIHQFNGDKKNQVNDRYSEYCKKTLKIKTVNLDGLDRKTTKSLLDTIAEVYNTYPELKFSIEEIMQTDDATMAIGIGSSYKKFILAISPNVYSNPAKAEKFLKKRIDQHFFAEGTTLNTIPYHEFGHMFEGIYIDNHYNEEEKERVWDNCLAASSILKQASIKCYNDEKRYEQELSKISQYALVSDSEGVAECIHMELTGRGNKFTHEVLKILRGE